MKFLDKIALNRLIKIITDFILSIMKMFQHTNNSVKPERKRPIIDLFRRWIK